MMPIFERLGYHSLHQAAGSRDGAWRHALRSAQSTQGNATPPDKKEGSDDTRAGETEEEAAEKSRVDQEEERVVKDLSKEMTLDMAKVS